MIGAALSPALDIHTIKEVPISIMQLPWQHLAIVVEQTAARARQLQVCMARTVFQQQLHEVDHSTLELATRGRNEEDLMWLRTLMHRGRWTADKLSSFQAGTDGNC